MFKIGCDTGGTFTDCVVFNYTNGKLKRFKAPSTPNDFSQGVFDVLNLAAKSYNLSLKEFLSKAELIIHGTTIATNLILSKQGESVGLITTKGFRDIIEQWWKEERRYDTRWPPPEPPCPRRLRREVEERIDFSGKELKSLNIEDLKDAIDYFRKNQIKTIAVSFLFSPINPAHEQQAKEIIKSEYKEAQVNLSSEVLPQLREYERTMATVLNAYVAPHASSYLKDLSYQLKNEGYKHELLIMQSNAGVASANIVSNIPIRLALSGPSSGPIAGVYFANLVKEENIISIDMGGTSFDVCLIKDKNIITTTDGHIGRFRLSLPTVDIHTLGAGGGSIAWVDSGGVLHVGPQSAGANPGPACYNLGGDDPTVTDANLILGYLNPLNFLGGKLKLNVELAKNALQTKIVDPLNIDITETARGIIKVVNNNMIDGINAVSVKRGYDPKNFALVVAGGAGPVHAARLAQVANLSKIIIPRVASAFCAFGMVISDLRHDYVQPYINPLQKMDLTRANKYFEQMEEQGKETLNSEGITESNMDFLWSIDMRYIGQIYEVETTIPREKLNEDNLSTIEELFHDKHKSIYGYFDKNSDVEGVHLRVKAIGRIKEVNYEDFELVSKEPISSSLKEKRDVYFEELDDYSKVPIYDGKELLPGNYVIGPAIIEEPDTTIIVVPDSECYLDKFNNYILKIK
ncbi:MAG: hydantoinase/oxoprolinase family protein [Candidatus Lokiarchaeota archaeon]|nr:hydantoinase/oxoprolinase family protein [Candidatus Lokiarchaeota archaeon]MBD3342540.1 hydantoinase/oxoprolinase family protein [Candidatus Lokiarchaeota archaeon]